LSSSLVRTFGSVVVDRLRCCTLLRGMNNGLGLHTALLASATSHIPEGRAFGSERRELPLAPIAPADIEEGQPVAHGVTLTRSPDGQLSTGLWDCSAGKFRWTFWVDEVVHILEGEATVREESGVVHELRPGSVAYFPIGLVVRWEIPRYVRKLFVVRSASAGPGARLRQCVRGVVERARLLTSPSHRLSRWSAMASAARRTSPSPHEPVAP
jgi:uncharacterized cupin superfamily protein